MSAVQAHRAADVLVQYAWAVDRGDLEALRAMVIDDVKISHTGMHASGVENFLDVYRSFLDSPIEKSQHSLSNIHVSAEGDGGLLVESYFEGTMFLRETSERLFGRYSDSLVESDGDLRIAHKRITVDRVMNLPEASKEFVRP
ncbi:nuclear transport factor 2 family protein [Rhodococcus sp. NPDC049939]|uniref:nuclear transport factor 2 family protein n=1 Tax=Rhodococcus sp. NPDC049939 TaxID=3155511 RepID=UPI0033FB6C7B